MEQTDPDLRSAARNQVLAELSAEKAARRKVLLAEMEDQLRAEFDVETLAGALRSSADAAVSDLSTPVVLDSDQETSGLSAVPLPVGRVAKSLLEILRESHETVFTKSVAEAELIKRQVKCTGRSFAHAYTELSHLGVLEFLPAGAHRGEKQFRFSSQYPLSGA